MSGTGFTEWVTAGTYDVLDGLGFDVWEARAQNEIDAAHSEKVIAETEYIQAVQQLVIYNATKDTEGMRDLYNVMAQKRFDAGKRTDAPGRGITTQEELNAATSDALSSVTSAVPTTVWVALAIAGAIFVLVMVKR